MYPAALLCSSKLFDRGYITTFFSQSASLNAHIHFFVNDISAVLSDHFVCKDVYLQQYKEKIFLNCTRFVLF